MKEEISDYYKNQGFDVVYVGINKDPRRVATLRKYSTKESRMVELKCPICGIKFIYDKRNLSTHTNPCCSRKCGGIKSHIKK